MHAPAGNTRIVATRGPRPGGPPSSLDLHAHAPFVMSTTAQQRKKKKRGGRKKRKEPRFVARTADKYELYQLSVQSPEEDVKFLARIFKNERGEQPEHLREDFVGTGLLSSHWIRRGTQYSAEGFDIDPEPVNWGKARNFAPLGDAAERMRFHQADVREPSERPPQVRCAHNFSYSVFKTRSELVGYFRSVYDDLAPDGIFSIDIHGGPESIEEMEESQDVEEGFEYVWDQAEYWPVTGEAKCYITFRFQDGSELKRAFAYDWRIWTLMELKEALLEVGFGRVDCYWEGTDSDGESGNGIFRKTTRGENCLSWIAYLIGIK